MYKATPLYLLKEQTENRTCIDNSCLHNGEEDQKNLIMSLTKQKHASYHKSAKALISIIANLKF